MASYQRFRAISGYEPYRPEPPDFVLSRICCDHLVTTASFLLGIRTAARCLRLFHHDVRGAADF